MKAKLVFENGATFYGKMFGCKKNIAGEVVFSTGMVGYQEELTDPSYTGQLVVMTFPLIGNYGVNKFDMECDNTGLNGLIVREKCNYPSNFRAEGTIDGFLNAHNVVGIEGVDTRAITRMLRDNGTMKAAIVTADTDDEEINSLINSIGTNQNKLPSKNVYTINKEGDIHVAFIDLGSKQSVLNSLEERNCKITVFPANVSADDILKYEPDLVFVSNGPGNPEDFTQTIDTIKILKDKFPICGICTGHLVIGLALGCKLEKLKFGLYSKNQPVKDLSTGKVYITSQSHNYVISELCDDAKQTYVNVNYSTCEGIKHKTLPIMSVQFHPDTVKSNLGTGFLFDKFLEEVK